MPQLDRYLVFSEVFWFIIFFLISYFLVYYFLVKFFYIIKTRSLIFLISQLTNDTLRYEKRQNYFLMPKYIENNFFCLHLCNSFVAIEKETFKIYKLFLLAGLTRGLQLEWFGENLFTRFVLTNIFPKFLQK